MCMHIYNTYIYYIYNYYINFTVYFHSRRSLFIVQSIITNPGSAGTAVSAKPTRTSPGTVVSAKPTRTSPRTVAARPATAVRAPPFAQNPPSRTRGCSPCHSDRFKPTRMSPRTRTAVPAAAVVPLCCGTAVPSPRPPSRIARGPQIRNRSSCRDVFATHRCIYKPQGPRFD